MKALWNEQLLAESNQTKVVEGNHYFPSDAINRAFFKPSDTHSSCPWKGKASYYSLEVNEKVNKDAAWYYPDPSPAASDIKDYVGFWKGVKITE
jgi:uncharacterized protein (DUF427 family)